MDPIAIYTEIRFDGTRTFTLFPDRVHIRGKNTLQSDFEAEIPLAILSPGYFKANFRHPACMVGIGMAIISLIVCEILVDGLKMTFAQNAPGLMVVMGVSGLILAAATYRKVEFVQFQNISGITVLNIARSGEQVAKLDSFIDALTKQIRVASGAA